jgi:hypothetical protein
MTKARHLGLLTSVVALFVFALGSSPARAAFGFAEWEAVTCKENVDVPAAIGPPGLVGAFPLDDDPAEEQCNKETPTKWFTQATGHPNFGITDFTLNTLQADKFKGFPDGFVKDLVVDTPEGLGVNPEATPVKCTPEELEAEPTPTCSPASIVGFNYLTVAAQGPPCEAPVPNVCLNARVKLPVYNLVPFQGVPSMVGFPTSDPGNPTFIVGDLDPSDQHVRFSISDIHAPDGTTEHPPIIGSRLVFNGQAGNGTYLTMPSNCAGGQTTTIFGDSYPNPFPSGEEESDEASFTTEVGADECDSAPFEPSVETSSGGTTDSPETTTVDVKIPQLEPGVRAQSHLLTSKVQLPNGTSINPSTANGLVACTDAQFKKGTDEPIDCPAASIIGTTDVETAALPPDSLHGHLYVAQPLNNDPSSGNQFRVFLSVESERYGVNVRLVGNVFPNLQTGQLTVLIPDNPQAPFNSFKVTIPGGPRGNLSSPFTCGPHTTTATSNSWSRPTEDVVDTSDVTLTNAPGGGPCPNTLAERPFAPGFSGGTRNHQAGAYSALDVHISRNDGNQELKRVDVNLPVGLLASLRGVEYCPEDRIAAAAGSSGADQLANPSCPASSLIGTVSTSAGTGSAPFRTDNGRAYLAGPYKGAPISIVIVTPAVAGPFDLGTVVIRTAANVNPETTQVHAVSDAIPDVFGGVRLDIRAIDVALDRQNYIVNPTSCLEQTFGGELFGGGADPGNPAAWTQFNAGVPFATTDCKALKFKPKFTAKILGGKKQTRRRAHPKLRAILQARRGDANLKRAAFILPKSTILDQGHIGTICTRVQLSAGSCPKNSVYGHAEATSPLIDGKLKGPVYLTSSNHQLPDLLVDLRGQIPVRLRGVISSVHGRLKSVFPAAPDAPVTKFVLTMKSGNKGLLVNTKSLCGKKQFAKLQLTGQNGRKLKKKKMKLSIKACKKHHKKKKGKGKK